MKILYIHQYFKTPQEGGAIRSYCLAKGLLEKGHEVVVITAHNKKYYQKKDIEGLQVHYLPVFYDNRLSFWSRCFAFLKFLTLSLPLIRSIPGKSLCYAVSTPLTVGVIALLIKKWLKVPYYFEVADLWPEAPIQMGVIRNKTLIKILYRLEKEIYSKAEKVVALSPPIQSYIQKIVPDKHIHLIPNIADCDFFACDNKKYDMMHNYRVVGKFVITYFGAIGKANHLEYLINLGELCQHGKLDVAILVVGEGAEKDKLEKLAKQKKLNNIQFFPLQSKQALLNILNVTDAAYVSFAKVPVLETGCPHKFFDALAAGKLTIVNFKGWLKELIEANECGIYYDPDSPSMLIEKLVPFISDNNILQKYKRNARRLGENAYSKPLIIEQFIEIFEPYQMVNSKNPTPQGQVCTLTS